jgi:hypothetical protein
MTRGRGSFLRPRQPLRDKDSEAQTILRNHTVPHGTRINHLPPANVHTRLARCLGKCPFLKVFSLVSSDRITITVQSVLQFCSFTHLIYCSTYRAAIRVTGATGGCHGTGIGSRRAPVPIGPSLSPHLFSDILDLSSFYSGLRCSGHLHLSLRSLSFCTSHFRFFTMTRAKLQTAVTLLFPGWVAIC